MVIESDDLNENNELNVIESENNNNTEADEADAVEKECRWIQVGVVSFGNGKFYEIILIIFEFIILSWNEYLVDFNRMRCEGSSWRLHENHVVLALDQEKQDLNLSTFQL